MPSTYQTLRKGAQGTGVSGMQTALNNAGIKVSNTGVYDDATEAAVKQYQQQNKLTVDGIAGDQTLSSLYGQGGQNTDYGYTPSAQVMNAQKYLESLQASKPGAYQGRFNDQINSIIDQIQNRQPFQYDVNADPLYQMYRDRYIANGQRAMQDTMAQAQAMTGGYGNSYAASVGQQAYNQSLEGLNDIIPQLEDRAYRRYNDEGDRLLQNYQLMRNEDESEYGRYRDTMADWQNERQAAENSYLNERNFDYGTFADWRNIQEQRAAEERQRDFQREMTAGDRDFQREMTNMGYDFQREMTAGDRDFQREMTDRGYDFQREMTAGDRDFQREMTNLGHDFEREMTDKGYDFQREMSGTEYERELAAQTKDYAYRTAMAMISAGKMPSDELLAAAGLTRKDIENWLGLNQQQVQMLAGGGGGTSGSGTKKSSGTGTNKKTTDTQPKTTFQTVNMAANANKAAATAGDRTVSIPNAREYAALDPLQKALTSQPANPLTINTTIKNYQDFAQNAIMNMYDKGLINGQDVLALDAQLKAQQQTKKAGGGR